MLVCKRNASEGSAWGTVSAWTRMGWLTRMAVIETLGGCCHGYEGEPQEGSKERKRLRNRGPFDTHNHAKEKM